MLLCFNIDLPKIDNFWIIWYHSRNLTGVLSLSYLYASDTISSSTLPFEVLQDNLDDKELRSTAVPSRHNPFNFSDIQPLQVTPSSLHSLISMLRPLWPCKPKSQDSFYHPPHNYPCGYSISHSSITHHPLNLNQTSIHADGITTEQAAAIWWDSQLLVGFVRAGLEHSIDRHNMLE